MTDPQRFTGKVEKGRVRFDQPERWTASVARHEGKPVEVTLGRHRVGRGLKANAYLWVVYQYIAEWSGHTKDEIHDAMRVMHLPGSELTLPTGELVKGLRSTRELDTVEFSDYVSRVKLWAAEQGLHIPEPDEVEVAL